MPRRTPSDLPTADDITVLTLQIFDALHAGSISYVDTWPNNTLHVHIPRGSRRKLPSVAKLCAAANNGLAEILKSGHNIWGHDVRASDYRIVTSLVGTLCLVPDVRAKLSPEVLGQLYQIATSALKLSASGQRVGDTNLMSIEQVVRWRKKNGQY